MRVLYKEIIREDENFLTYKIYFPKEALPEILKEKKINRVFKGDQNLLWDGLITDISLKLTLNDKIPFYPFVHDERLGTGDQRLVPFYKDDSRFTITEDYAQRITGAVYINQDVSYGLFYGVPIEPKEYKELGFHLTWIAKKWKLYKEVLEEDGEFKKALESLGFSWDYENISKYTRMGPMANKEALEDYFRKNPSSEIYYLFSKSLGWYGIVPKYPEDISFSSIYLDESNILPLIKKLFLLSIKGNLRQVKDRNKRKGIITRARKIKKWFDEFLREKELLSILDLHKYLAEKIIKDVYGDSLKLDFNTTSELLRISRGSIITKDFYYFFDLCLKYSQVFMDAYNNSLNKAKLDLKRLYFRDNSFYPPFFIEIFSQRKDGRKILTRCNIEIRNTDKEVFIKLFSPHCSSTTIIPENSLNSACDFIKALLSTENFPLGFSLIGKAGPFMAEMRRDDKVLAVPELGSKYAPMVDYFLGELRRRGLEIPPSHLLRIRLNILDNLKYLDKFSISLPKFLSIYFGKEISNVEFSERWRDVVRKIEEFLKIFPKTMEGEYFHLAKVILLRKGYKIPLNERVKRYMDKIKEHLEAIENMIFPKEFLEELNSLIEKRSSILSFLKKEKENSPPRFFEEKELIEYKILFLFATLIRSLVLVKESLTYINYRPYTLSIYLLGGDTFLKILVENAQFNLEEINFKI